MRVHCVFLTSLIGVALAGCAPTPPPPRVPVPAAPGHEVTMQHDEVKPMPDQQPRENAPPGPGFDDVPLVNQQPPEEPAYVDAYNRVGRPRITVFVNRTLEGKIIPVSAAPEASASTGSSLFGDANTNVNTYDTSASDYLKPGQYDEASTRSIDYAAIENVLTDWLSASNQVTIVSPSMTRQRLTDEELKDLQGGRPQILSELAKKLDADVLVQVQAIPTKQTSGGPGIRILSEAINTRGGQSLGRAFVDVPPPLEKTQINKYTRFLARKLMDGMTASWTTLAATKAQAPAPASTTPTPAPAPAPAPANPSPTTTELPATMPTNH